MRSSRKRARALPPRSAKPKKSTAQQSTRQSSRNTRHASLQTYAEPSSDDEGDEEEEGEEGGEIVVEEDEDEDDSNSDDELGDRDFTPCTGKRRWPQRAAAPKAAVCESPAKRPRRAQATATTRHDDNGDDDDVVYLSPASDNTPRKSGRQDNRQKTTARASRAVVKCSMPQSPPDTDTPAVSLPWTTLPYYTLCRIFEYAAGSLDSVADARWLAIASRTCRAFAEPALRTLYTAPPLLAMNMAHGFANQVTGRPASGTARTNKPPLFDYGRKVRELRIDVGSLAGRVHKGRHLDIPALVAACPQLKLLDLYHYKDAAPYKLLAERLTWKYPEQLFRVLGMLPAPSANDDEAQDAQEAQEAQGPGSVQPPLRIQSWSWNARLLGREFQPSPDRTRALERMLAMHLTPGFSNLRELRLLNFHRPSRRMPRADEAEQEQADAQAADQWAALLAALPDLRHLAVESSTAANEHLLPQLPGGLETLTLVNCGDVTAEALAEYLVRHGKSLRRLVLHHNRGLSLGFLPVLGSACPRLQRLEMNLTYYSAAGASSTDSGPTYDVLLTPQQVPTWPADLAVLELEHLRRWPPEATEVFFQSLVDAAPRLPHLRTLAIKATFEVPWRQRLEMRQSWLSMLQTVYARPAAPPPEPARSLDYYAAQRRAERATARLQSKRERARARQQRQGEEQQQQQRRSGRLAEAVPAALLGHTLRRKASLERISYREPDTDEEEEEVEEEELVDSSVDSRPSTANRPSTADGPSTADRPSTADSSASLFVQGLCDVVDIRIDNQKPGEIQYGMDDFLDSDRGSDDEWNGDDVLEDTGYAW